MNILSLTDIKNQVTTLPEQMSQIPEEVSVFDTQYTLQIEEVDKTHPLYVLRLERNTQASVALYSWLSDEMPDTFIIPNGTIQEMGVAYRIARMLGIKVVTFEFGDQAESIWLAQNDQIMLQNTDDLWKSFGDQPLSAGDEEKISQLFYARKNAQLWGKLKKRWQNTPAQGEIELRKKLNVDDRPIVLLATNVLGDSLTLAREVFSENMADWLKRTVKFFSARQDFQLIIRIHPGELFSKGTSMMDVLKEALPILPDNIHLIGPGESFNTYDIVSISDLGLVYTTTVGLDMAMSGLPVIVSGNTHYRNRGFTFDPESWQSYFQMLNRILADSKKYLLCEESRNLAWRYAYLFFFVFPFPFPWHILYFKEDIRERNMKYVLSDQGIKKYSDTFSVLAAEKIDWFEKFSRETN
jgi:hypothetical protein